MPSLFIIGHLKTKGGAARQTVINALSRVSEHAAANEPGVYKYCVALPQEGDGTSVFAIEEYADQSVMDKHMACQPVADLLKIFNTEPTLFSDVPVIYGLPNKLASNVSFTRPSLGKLRDPVIVFANFGYKVGLASEAVPGWTGIVEHAERNEEGTLMYTVIVDEEKSWIRTIEAYESADVLQRAHMKNSAIAANQKKNGDMSTGEKDVYRLKMVAGYLYKEEPKP